MEFGEWLQNIRKAQNLDVRSLAQITGVDSSTISRTENLHTQTTLYTAFRISEGLGISLIDLIDILAGKRLSALEKSSFIENSDVLTLQYIDQIIGDFTAERSSVTKLMASHFNVLLKEMQLSGTKEFSIDELDPYQERDIYRFLYSSPLAFRPDMKYPLHVKPDTILYTYKRNGALMLQDVELYVRKVPFKNLLPRSLAGSPPSSRVETGASLERIKFSDVLQFDIKEELQGVIIGMYWEACRFYAKYAFAQLNPDHSSNQSNLSFRQKDLSASLEVDPYGIAHKERVMSLSLMVTIVYRWYQSFKGNEFVFKME